VSDEGSWYGSLLKLSWLPLYGIVNVAGQVISGDLGPFFVHNLEKGLHSFLKSVQILSVYFSEILQRFVISKQGEHSASQLLGEMIHTPDL